MSVSVRFATIAFKIVSLWANTSGEISHDLVNPIHLVFRLRVYQVDQARIKLLVDEMKSSRKLHYVIYQYFKLHVWP